MERAVNVFCSDLRARGVRFTEPCDPAHDPQWSRTLIATYPLPSFTPPSS